MGTQCAGLSHLAQGARTPPSPRTGLSHAGTREMDGSQTQAVLMASTVTAKVKKNVFPQQVEGIKMIINKTLSSFFKVSHTFHLSAVAPSNYRFHVEYLQSDSDSKETSSPMLIGEMDSSGSLKRALSLFHLSERIRAKAVFSGLVFI
ncbi:hypothetical protein NFI96_017367 [Prochilodus magdalenae]|nr:hypothetical protein NFI96_017367 [Prochilodus magdalenae]